MPVVQEVVGILEWQDCVWHFPIICAALLHLLTFISVLMPKIWRRFSRCSINSQYDRGVNSKYYHKNNPAVNGLRILPEGVTKAPDCLHDRSSRVLMSSCRMFTKITRGQWGRKNDGWQTTKRSWKKLAGSVRDSTESRQICWWNKVQILQLLESLENIFIKNMSLKKEKMEAERVSCSLFFLQVVYNLKLTATWTTSRSVPHR